MVRVAARRVGGIERARALALTPARGSLERRLFFLTPFNYSHGKQYGVEFTANYTAHDLMMDLNLAAQSAQGTEIDSAQSISRLQTSIPWFAAPRIKCKNHRVSPRDGWSARWTILRTAQTTYLLEVSGKTASTPGRKSPRILSATSALCSAGSGAKQCRFTGMYTIS